MKRISVFFLSFAVFFSLVFDSSIAEAKKRRRKKGPEKITDQYLYDLSFERKAAKCKIGENEFDVLIRGKTFATDEDEIKNGSPYVFIKTDNKVVMASKESEEFTYQFLFKSAFKDSNENNKVDDAKKISISDSVCDKTTAFSMGGGYVAILLKTRNQPVVIVYESHSKKITEVNRQFSGMDLIMSHSVGFKFRSSLQGNVKTQEQTTSESELIQNKEMAGNLLLTFSSIKSNADGAFEKNGVKYNFKFVDVIKPWKLVSLQKGHLKVKESIDYVFENQDLKKYFENSAKMQKALGFKSDTGVLQKKFVYQAVSDDEKQNCILFQNEMTLPSEKSEWLCR